MFDSFLNFKNKKSVVVDVDTLDNLFYKPEYTGRIKLLKLDIEGNELKAIMGAKRIISECKPHIAFEVCLTFWAYLDTSIDVLFDFLRGNGDELFIVKRYRLYPRKYKLYPYKWLDSRVLNIIAVHKSRKSQIREIFQNG